MSATVKAPKSIKLPWSQSSLIHLSDGRLFVTGELGAIATVDGAWKAVPWPKVDGFDTSLRASDTTLAVGVTGHVTAKQPHVELRSLETGEVRARLGHQAQGNLQQLRWAPSQDRLVAVVSTTVEKEFEHLSILDVTSGRETVVQPGKFTSLAAEFIDDATLIVFASRGSEPDAAVFHVDVATGKVKEQFASTHDLVCGVTRLAKARFLVATLWNGWLVADAKGRGDVGGPGGKVCLLPDGVASVERGKNLVVCDLEGNVKARLKAKKSVDSLAGDADRLYVLEQGQIELVER